jgi:hypothetical protein
MNDSEKLRIILTHWMDHNEEHAGEYRRWAEKSAEASPDLLAAVEGMKEVNRSLARAVERLGGPLPVGHSH